MPDIEFSGKRKSKTTAFSFPPNILEKLENFYKSGKYGNKSAIAQQALSEFFAREEMRNECGSYNSMVLREEYAEYNTSQKLTTKEVAEFLESDEGKSLIRSIIQESLASNKDKKVVAETTNHERIH